VKPSAFIHLPIIGKESEQYLKVT
jgi:hypothetical protein